MEIHESIEIGVPPERVWPLLVEPASVRKWYVTLKEFRYQDEGHGGPGAHLYLEEQAVGPMVMKLDFEATEWSENRAIGLHMTGGSGVRAYDQRWALEPTAGGSRFVFDEKVELPFGPLGRLFGAVGRGSSERHVAEMLTRLKDLAEA
jgi:uncharacterized protein YndB with AHSA1/START domain